jgi:hypothetical protein
MSSVKRNDAMSKTGRDDPNNIYAVIPTHAQIDHIDGIMAAAAAAISRTRSSIFPKRTWNSGPTTRGWELRGRLGPCPHEELAANRDRILFYDAGKDVIPGHTVGHTCFVFDSRGKSLFLTSDLMHHVILIEKPQMEVAFDTDRSRSTPIRSRSTPIRSRASRRASRSWRFCSWPGIVGEHVTMRRPHRPMLTASFAHS